MTCTIKAALRLFIPSFRKEKNIYNESREEINVKNISAGIYFVKVLDGEKSYCRKLIVE